MVMNFLSFYLSGKAFISSSYLKEKFAEYRLAIFIFQPFEYVIPLSPGL